MTRRHASSAQRRGRQGARRSRAQSVMRGVTTSAPEASPSHQVTQMGPKSLQGASPPSESVVTPMVALTAVASAPASAVN